MTNPLELVKEFHIKMRQPILDTPQIPDQDRVYLRMLLVTEEQDELWDALNEDDLIEIAGELADVVYVVYGTALEYGIPLDRVLKEKHRSNMTKTPTDGKAIKGEGYSPPNIKECLGI